MHEALYCFKKMCQTSHSLDYSISLDTLGGVQSVSSWTTPKPTNLGEKSLPHRISFYVF